MVLGPFDPGEFALGLASSPGYYLSGDGVVMVIAYKGQLLPVRLEGAGAYQGDLDMQRAHLARIPIERIQVEFESTTKHGRPPLGGVAIVGEQAMGLAVRYTVPNGSVESILVDVKTCRAVAPTSQLGEWLWLTNWRLTSLGTDGTRRAIAEGGATDELPVDVQVSWV